MPPQKRSSKRISDATERAGDTRASKKARVPARAEELDVPAPSIRRKPLGSILKDYNVTPRVPSLKATSSLVKGSKDVENMALPEKGNENSNVLTASTTAQPAQPPVLQPPAGKPTSSLVKGSKDVENMALPEKGNENSNVLTASTTAQPTQPPVLQPPASKPKPKATKVFRDRRSLPQSELKTTNPPTRPTNRSLRNRLVLSTRDETLPYTGDTDELAKYISDNRLWTPGTLTEFRNTNVTEITLTEPKPTGSHGYRYTPLLRAFLHLDGFASLSRLSLASLPLMQKHVLLLKTIPSLEVLNLSNCGIGNSGVHYLGAHYRTLRSLDISGNEGVTDKACGSLVELHALESLYLHGTTFTLPGLRDLVMGQETARIKRERDLAYRNFNPSSEFSSPPPIAPLPSHCHLVTLPEFCNTYFDRRNANNLLKYYLNIPSVFVKEPRMVDGLSVAALEANLKFHQRYDSNVLTSGSKAELNSRLKGILEARAGDIRILRAMRPVERV